MFLHVTVNSVWEKVLPCAAVFHLSFDVYRKVIFSAYMVEIRAL